MKELEGQSATVVSRFVEINGKRYLAGIAYLPEIGWYEITLLDLDVLLPLSRFGGILLVYGLTLLTALVLFNLVLGRLVLRPIKQLEIAMGKVQAGQFAPDILPVGGKDEIGRLMRHFKDMAESVWNAKSELEAKVSERTEALERLSKTDSLTRMLNRRGMTERIEAEFSRSKREGGRFGILWLDVDYFKEINDRYGHPMGDLALVEVADLIRSIIRPYDSASRWGGDEFLVLVQSCDEVMLMALGDRIRTAIASSATLRTADGHPVQLSVSIGAAVSEDVDQLETLLQNADHALYAAKESGRNCLRLHGG
jgi:diguanylate cyclase (GGDEF)-like protein